MILERINLVPWNLNNFFFSYPNQNLIEMQNSAIVMKLWLDLNLLLKCVFYTRFIANIMLSIIWIIIANLYKTNMYSGGRGLYQGETVNLWRKGRGKLSSKTKTNHIQTHWFLEWVVICFFLTLTFLNICFTDCMSLR